MTNMNKAFYKIVNVILGIVIILYVLNRRFLTFRVPKELYLLENLNPLVIRINVLIIVVIGLLSSLFILYHSIKVLLEKPTATHTLSSIINVISTIINNALFAVYHFIARYLPNGYNKISTLAYYFYEIFYKQSETLFLFIQYVIRIIILSCFLIDVVVYFKFYYMYKAFYLLSIILFIKVLIYILKDFATNLEEARSYLIITPMGIDPNTGLPLTNYALKPEHYDANLTYHIGQFILLHKMNGYLDMYDRYNNFFTPYVNVLLYSFYFMGWLYILVKNFLILYPI